jgi:hypothetical protein
MHIHGKKIDDVLNDFSKLMLSLDKNSKIHSTKDSICKYLSAKSSARILLFCKYISAIVIRNQVLGIIITYIVSLL